MINGELHKLELCKETKDGSDEVRTYRTRYETLGYDVSKCGKRKEILFVLEVILFIEMLHGLVQIFKICCC